MGIFDLRGTAHSSGLPSSGQWHRGATWGPFSKLECSRHLGCLGRSRNLAIRYVIAHAPEILQKGSAAERVLFFQLAIMAYTTVKVDAEMPLFDGKNFENPL